MVKVVVKNIEWINHLDDMYRKSKINRNNPKFYYYPKIEIKTESNNIHIIYRKQEKTQILFGDIYGRRAYLSDVDIINIIVNAELEVYEIICDILMLYISNPVIEEVEFKINDQEYYYRSIIPASYENNKINVLRTNSFETGSDIKIKYIDLITLISLIINKEFLVDVLRGHDRVLRQSKKILVLSKFYREKQYIDELQKLKYDTSKNIEEVYFNNKIAKSLDIIFDDFI